MRIITAMLLMAAATPIKAQEPTEEQKISALKRAYQLNESKVVKVEKIMPVSDPAQKNVLDAIADTTNPEPVKPKPKSKHRK